MTNKIAIALSGGVDSGTAAYLLRQQGYTVIGFFMQLWKEKNAENKASSLESLEAAKKVANFLNIPLKIVDYSSEFKKQIVDYFIDEYQTGRTPNPCVMCNHFIKFGRLLEEARKLGCNQLATGHYARIKKFAKTAKLLRGVDKSKDQTYFLWKLNQQQLNYAIFPIGTLLKKNVRRIAKKNNLPTAERPDSQEICFLTGDYRDFLKSHIPDAFKPGAVVNTKGEKIGKHFGLPLYTIGQRRGFEVQSAVPLYVVGVDIKNNTLIVGRDRESETKSFRVNETNWIQTELKTKDKINCEVQIRYRGPTAKATVHNLPNRRTNIKLTRPQRSVTPGQSAVFYHNNEVLGGGVIQS